MTELKTLKDLNKNKWEAVITREDIYAKFDKIDDIMHDRFIFYSKDSWVWKNELRAEAVKWVKELREAQTKEGERVWDSRRTERIHKIQEEICGYNAGCNEYACDDEASELGARILMTFFNLSEEDLK